MDSVVSGEKRASEIAENANNYPREYVHNAEDRWRTAVRRRKYTAGDPLTT